MEHHRTRPRQSTPRGRTPPVPPQVGRNGGSGGGGRGGERGKGPGGAGRGGGPAGHGHDAVRRRPLGGTRPAPAAPPAASPVRRLPNPRLTGLGAGLLFGGTALTLGWLDELLFGASPTVYGVLFMPLCVLAGLWVSGTELVAAPVVVPIAYTLGLLPMTEAGDGIGHRLMSLFTALGTQVGWLYSGTLVAGLVALGRGLARVARRRRAALRERAVRGGGMR
ncbi:DUF6542 domain-containing protein [Streptomyces sp. NPDC002553]|uniref:DUF6542 domain-containing protein n=1 Tax=Streptomyces sp. NPDC002553 TaxID=3154417 RepID=UPI003330EE0B